MTAAPEKFCRIPEPKVLGPVTDELARFLCVIWFYGFKPEIATKQEHEYAGVGQARGQKKASVQRKR